MRKTTVVFVLAIGLLCSCGEDRPQEVETIISSKEIVQPTSVLLFQHWVDRKDLSHEVVFSDYAWIDIYNNDTVSQSPFILLNNFPDRGGKPSATGMFLQLQESPGNYYLFKIETLDSLSLELNFISADLHYSFFRKSAMDKVQPIHAQDSL